MSEYNDNDKYYIGEVLTEENLNNVWQYILTLLEVNGGEGSLINADLLDGHHASDFTLKSEVIDSTIQPNFYIGESVLRNEREEDKQFLLTEDVLLKNIHGWSSLGSLLEGFFQDTSSDNKYRSYYNDLIRKLNDYTTTNGNLENDQNKNLICKNRDPEIYFDPLNSLPLDEDIWEISNTRDIKINEEEKCLELSNCKAGDVFTLYGKKLTIGSKISFLIKSDPTLGDYCQIRFSDNFDNISPPGPGLDFFYLSPDIPIKDGYLKLSFDIREDGTIAESTYGVIFDSGHYFSLVFESDQPDDSPIFIKNLKIEDSIQNPCTTETYLPIKGDNPDIENKIPQLISNILDGVENWNSDSGGYKFDQNKIDKKLTTLLNSIISMMVLDLLDSKNHDDRISDIEVFTNKHFGVSIRDMIKHIQNENYDFITYECLDDNGSIAETRCGYKLDADSVNGIQIVPITQEGFNKLPEEIRNSWRYYFIIKDEDSMPSEEEYVSPVYNLVSSEFKIKFSLKNNIRRDGSENIVGGTLDLMYSVNESIEKNHLISVFDFDSPNNENSLISKEYLTTLLDGVFTNLEKEKISLDDIRTAIEEPQNIYRDLNEFSMLLNSLNNLVQMKDVEIFDLNEQITNLNEQIKEMKKEIAPIKTYLDNGPYLKESEYENDITFLKEYLDSILE